MDNNDLTQDGLASPETLAHLRLPLDGTCWWCRSRPATTGEHKFKKSDLSQLMEPGDTLLWGNGEQLREIRGKSGITRDRYGVVKFPKSMCGPCNNERSKPFDLSYQIHSSHVRNTALLRKMPGLNFQETYGNDWKQGALDLARYYAKHFGCRLTNDGVPVPQSLRDFLDGATDMWDAHMVVVTTDSVHKEYGKGLSISPNVVRASKDLTCFTSCCLISYVGSIGIRYEWIRDGIPDERRSQFFDYPHPVINCFTHELDALEGSPRRPGWFARLCQWANRPR